MTFSPSSTSATAARRAAAERMDRQFPTNRGLRPVFLMLANAHPCAIDYIEQYKPVPIESRF